MNCLLVIAADQPTQPPQGGGGLGLILLLLVPVVFYFFVARPQRAQARRQLAILESLTSGDRVVTIGGIHGTVRSIDEDSLALEVAPDVVVTFAKQAVARRVVDDDDDDADLEQASSD